MTLIKKLKYYLRRLFGAITLVPQKTSSKYLMKVYYWLSQKTQKNGSIKQRHVGLIQTVLHALVRRIGDRYIEFELTNICNARCIFCPYPDFLKTDKKFVRMDFESYDKALSTIEKLDYSLISFTPTTGDTLLHPEWDKMMAKAIQLDKIKQVIFYSNAILLDDTCIEKFIELLKEDKEKKFFSIMFSVGGMDAETYKRIFQVNKFDVVVQNINNFQKRLLEENIVVGVYIKMRIPEEHVVEEVTAKNLFNRHGYPFTTIDDNKYFEVSEHLKTYDELKYTENHTVPKKACTYLQKTRFAADGGIWADGCVLSELPNDSALRLGTLNDSWDKIEANRAKIVEDWEEKQEIPLPCMGCTIYKCK